MVCFVSGCGGQANTVKPLQIGNEAIVSQQDADEAKQIVLAMDEVLEVKGLTHDQKIYLSPRVKQFDRLHLNDIRKRSHASVAKRFPKHDIFLSSDKKIYMELKRLETELKNREISEKRLKEELVQLEDKMKG